MGILFCKIWDFASTVAVQFVQLKGSYGHVLGSFMTSIYLSCSNF